MRRTLALCFASTLVFAQAAAAAVVPQEHRTLFHYAEKAWAVGTVKLPSKPLTFRDGKILVFPGVITDLLWAPDGTKPRNLMLVHEVATDDKDKPFFQENDEFFAPIALLPDHSYWKDNLPYTRRHAVAGGRRYVFRGEQATEARRLVGAYLTAAEVKGLDRWKGQIAAVSDALGSTIPTIREDAVLYLSVYGNLGRDFDAKSVPAVTSYLSGSAPADEKARLVDALVAARVSLIEPALVELSARDDATGAVALAGLERLGKGPATDRLVALSRSGIPEAQVLAAETLAGRAASDAAALARSKEILADAGSTPDLRKAVTTGLARAGGDPVVAVLAEAVERGDAGSRDAGEALALIGSPAAQAALTKILEQKQGEAALAAVAGLGRMRACRECAAVLHKQHESHADPAVRALIGVVLEVPVEHKH